MMPTFIFWLLIGLMLLLAGGILWRTLFRAPQASAPARISFNLAIYRQRLSEIEHDYARGQLSQQEYDEQCAELQQSLLQDQQTIPTTPHAPAKHAGWVIMLVLPAMAIGLYFMLGRHQAIDPQKYVQQNQQQNLPQMIAQLENEVEHDPQNAENWLMLGRAYGMQNRLNQARDALARAYQLAPANIDVLLDYAEIQARLNNNQFDDAATALITRAKQLAPQSRRVLWLDSVIAMQNGQRDKAIAIWEALLTEAEDNSQEKQMLQTLLARNQTDAPADQTTTATVQVRVTLEQSLRTQAAPEDQLFIFARAAQGPKMPLAVVKKQVRDLPLTVELSDHNAMTEALRLSAFPEIIVSARISKTGQATPSSGDLQGSSAPFNHSRQKQIDITISERIP